MTTPAPRLRPRVALLAAFPFPLAQGSQIFVAEQAAALAAAGADVTLFCYGGGEGGTAAQGHAPENVSIVRAPLWLSSTPLRAGPSARKPLADTALLATWVRAAAEWRPAAVMAHNAEAALVAIATRLRTRVPVIYVAHTLLRHELSAYGPPWLASLADAVGAALDAGIARGADAAIALSAEAATALRRHARGPVFLLPPGLDPAAPPADAAIAAVCAAHGVTRERYALYAGNLDGYQDLDLLAEAARRLPHVPCLVATHDPRRSAPPPLRTVRVSSAGETRALTYGCAVAILARRRPGGFPVKLLNYMEAARPIVAYARIAEGLEHGVSAELLSDGAGPAELAHAVERVLADPVRAAALGRAARARLDGQHAWPRIAEETLSLITALNERRESRA